MQQLHLIFMFALYVIHALFICIQTHNLQRYIFFEVFFITILHTYTGTKIFQYKPICYDSVGERAMVTLRIQRNYRCLPNFVKNG